MRHPPESPLQTLRSLRVEPSQAVAALKAVAALAKERGRKKAPRLNAGQERAALAILSDLQGHFRQWADLLGPLDPFSRRFSDAAVAIELHARDFLAITDENRAFVKQTLETCRGRIEELFSTGE